MRPRSGTRVVPRLGLALGLLAGLIAPLALVGCGRDADEPAPAQTWVNPDTGSTSKPMTLQASQLPYTGKVTEGINYFRIVGLPADAPQVVALTGLQSDADLFVLSNPAFDEYQCSSLRGGAEDDLCATAPTPGTELYVEVYGFHGTDTRFLLDVW
jgi:hypothetical protein